MLSVAGTTVAWRFPINWTGTESGAQITGGLRLGVDSKVEGPQMSGHVIRTLSLFPLTRSISSVHRLVGRSRQRVEAVAPLSIGFGSGMAELTTDLRVREPQFVGTAVSRS